MMILFVIKNSCDTSSRLPGTSNRDSTYLGMDQYLLIPFLGG